MEFIWELAGFAAKSLFMLVLVVAGAALIAAIIQGAVRRSRPKELGRIHLTCLNDHYQNIRRNIEDYILDKKTRKQKEKEQKKADKSPQDRPKIWTFVFDGDLAATQVNELREQVTATLSVANPDRDEVVVLLESPGGVMQNYGLAASQLVRLRDAGVPITVCIDKVAASGGYMMAAVANRIVAAPFAIVGSIGVLAMVPNIHRLLKKYDVDYMELTAGKYKRTISYMGEITEDGLEHFHEELETSHALFKRFIGRYRTQLDVEQIATGEHWFGEDAVAVKLIDELGTSDDYLMQRADKADIYRIDFEVPRSVKEKFAGVLSESGDRLLLRWWNRLGGSARFHARD